MMNNSANSFCQASTFGELADRMFFNILIHEPDSSIYPFIKKYYPQFSIKQDSTGWTAYPDSAIPEHYSVVNSFQFKRHPFFDVKFRTGQLDIVSHNTIDGAPWALIDIRLWFSFDNKEDAQAAFATLSYMFDRVSKIKKVFDNRGRKVAQYAEQDEIESINAVEFILTEDELYTGKYKLFFRIGALTYTDYTNSI